jgi:hypothetical protein
VQRSHDIKNNHLENIKVKGVIDDNEDISYPNIDNPDSIVDYEPQENDIFIIALGSPVIRYEI